MSWPEVVALRECLDRTLQHTRTVRCATVFPPM